jgi:hypothetical protein
MRVGAQIPSDETKPQEAGVMAASLLYGHHRKNIFPATAVFMEGQGSGPTISARHFRILPSPVNAKKRGELAQTFLQGVLEARQATAKMSISLGWL